jgi:hypothetical protein
MRRKKFLKTAALTAALAGAAPAVRGAVAAANPMPKTIAGIDIPDSYVARQALQQARDVEDPQILRHSIRSFVFAELIAKARGIPHDRELVYVAAILHDIGLSPQFSTPHRRFEVDSAEMAKQLLALNEVPADKVRIVWDAITLHSIYSIARFKEAEVNLVSAGVVTDVGAAFASLLSQSAIEEIFAALPRTGFNDAFLAQLSDYAKRKPDVVAGTFVEDVAARVVPGYHHDNFYDSMKSGDAFAH